MNRKTLFLTIIVCFILAGCTKESIPAQIGQTSPSPAITGATEPSESAASSSVASSSAASSSVASSSAASSSAASSTVASLNSGAGSASSEQLKSILGRYTTDPVLFFTCIPVGDSQNAAFALAGGNVWYVTASGVHKLKSNIEYPKDNHDDVPVLWTVGDIKIFKCENDGGGSSSKSFAWYVKNGKPIELPYTGMQLSYSGKGQFTTIGDAFDLNSTDGIETGHTYKLYYLYWAPDGLKEYGGLKITLQQLQKVKGSQAIIDTIIKSGYTIDDIYYRANNIININYHSGDKQNGNFDNVTLIYRNGTVTPGFVYPGPDDSKTESLNKKNLSSFSYGGIYEAAEFPKIASYPDQFPMN